MGAEVGRHGMVPHGERWAAAKPVVATKLNPRDFGRLDFAIANGDMTVIPVNGEWERLLKVAAIDVFYQLGDKKYKLREQRFTIVPGRDPEEVVEQVISGDMSGITPSRFRPNRTSISERIKIEGESSGDAMLRALHEEIFDLALERKRKGNPPKKYPDLDILLQTHLKASDGRLVHVEADAKDSSFPGIAATYFVFPAQITFTPDMDVPIDVRDGRPQPLHEFAEGKYINRYVWDEVPFATI